MEHKREAPAGQVLNMLLDRLEMEYRAQIEQVLAADRVDQGYPEESQFDVHRRLWLIPIDKHLNG